MRLISSLAAVAVFSLVGLSLGGCVTASPGQATGPPVVADPVAGAKALQASEAAFAGVLVIADADFSAGMKPAQAADLAKKIRDGYRLLQVGRVAYQARQVYQPTGDPALDAALAKAAADNDRATQDLLRRLDAAAVAPS